MAFKNIYQCQPQFGKHISFGRWQTLASVESHTYDVIGGTGEGRLGTSWELEAGEGRETMEPG